MSRANAASPNDAARYQATSTRYSLGPFSFTLNTASISSAAARPRTQERQPENGRSNPLGRAWRWVTASKESSRSQPDRGSTAPVDPMPSQSCSVFAAYDNAWQNTPSSPSPEDSGCGVAWPSADLALPSLLQRDGLEPPPGFQPPVSSWTEDTIITANTHAFYLAAVGIKPIYSLDQRTGQVSTGFRKADASVTQVKTLISTLKKERLRWHPDHIEKRLGKRETDGAREASRTVFRAICGLLDQAVNDSWL